MDPTLSQEEIDALLEAVAAGEVDVEREVGGGKRFEPYDFRKGYRTVQEMPTLEVVNQRFATQYRALFSGLVNRSVHVEVSRVQTIPFSELLETIPEHASFSLFSMDPLNGYGMVAIWPGLSSLVLDLLLGNPKVPSKRKRGQGLSLVEMRVSAKLAELALSGYRQAWFDVKPLSLTYLRTEQASLFTPIAGDDDPVVVVRVWVTMGEVNERMAFVIPDDALDPIRAELVRGFRIAEKSARSFGRELVEQLRDVEVMVVVEIGRLSVTVEELLGLAVGDVLSLPVHTGGPVIGFVEGVPKFLGRTGARHGSIAVEVAERLEEVAPLALTSGDEPEAAA